MQLNAAERAIAPTNNQSHNTAVRDLCVFLEAQTEPRPMVLESFRVMVRACMRIIVSVCGILIPCG